MEVLGRPIGRRHYSISYDISEVAELASREKVAFDGEPARKSGSRLQQCYAAVSHRSSRGILTQRRRKCRGDGNDDNPALTLTNPSEIGGGGGSISMRSRVGCSDEKTDRAFKPYPFIPIGRILVLVRGFAGDSRLIDWSTDPNQRYPRFLPREMVARRRIHDRLRGDRPERGRSTC